MFNFVFRLWFRYSINNSVNFSPSISFSSFAIPTNSFQIDAKRMVIGQPIRCQFSGKNLKTNLSTAFIFSVSNRLSSLSSDNSDCNRSLLALSRLLVAVTRSYLSFKSFSRCADAIFSSSKSFLLIIPDFSDSRWKSKLHSRYRSRVPIEILPGKRHIT